MAEKLTAQQELAVKDRGGNLLISAAAGSGKTKVLVDRLMSYLLEPVQPANLDDFLIITYTKAAASELRGKISAKLTQHMAQQPENVHLQRQMQRLYLTPISTVHAFCADILREYAYLVDIPGDFRVADENECSQLRDAVMTRLLESAYDSAETDADFRAFVDAQGLGRDDRLVPEILLKVYDSARCHLDPDGWLEECVNNVRVGAYTDVAQTIWGRFLMEDLFHYLDLQIRAMERCAAAAEKTEFMEKPALLLTDTVRQLRYLRESPDWNTVIERKRIDFGRMVFSKQCTEPDLADRIKTTREACKRGLERKLKNFCDDSAAALADMAGTESSVRGITALVRRFDREYSHAKRSRRVLDFGDLEHRMLDLLLGKNRSGVTAAAREIGSRFREVMVDEYQDSNSVQDAIFSALTGQRHNCFMVGDVKQSIYQFRLADPGIFLKKYRAFQPAQEAAPGEDRKVILSSNFRSGSSVLEAVNDVFRTCMSPNVGGLNYGAEEALHEGIPHIPLEDPEVELWTVPVQENTYEEEAAFVARRISRLLKEKSMVRDGDSLRPIAPEDIAILLRSPGSSGSYYSAALAREGIRCVTGGGEDLLQTEEICVLRAILQAVSNPRQDIPLIAALASPVFGFTADDLAAIRCVQRNSSFYEALMESRLEKAASFLAVLQELRREARLGTLTQLIQKIFSLTGMDSIYAAMAAGETRRDHLQFFYSLAADFESVSRRDLEQFLEHLDSLEERGLVVSGESASGGAVTLTSIHKSKGLEYPVVIVAGLSRTFNRENLRAHVLCDQKLGLGLSAVDSQNRLRYPTIARRAIAVKCGADSLSEELRVLYVALTRAKDRLIMTFASQRPENDVTDLALRMDMTDPELLAADVVCPGEWVLMTALRHTEAGALFALGGKPSETRPGVPVWKIGVSEAPVLAGALEIRSEEEKISADMVEQLKEELMFCYGHEAATMAPSKQTATQRKGRDKDLEAAQNASEPKAIVRHWRKPAFGVHPVDGRDYGNALHAAMQYIRFDRCGDLAGVREEIRRLAKEAFIRPEQEQLVDCGKIAAFFATPFGQKLRQRQNVIREFKFSVLEDGVQYDPELEGEKILLQGVVDCAILEEDGITVIDFKTDYVTEQMLTAKTEYYRPQVQAYAQALQRIYKMPVKECLLYFFHLNRFAQL